MSPKTIKLAAAVIAPSLLKIIKIGIPTGLYPQLFKNAKLVPIYKGGPNNDPSTYRPISIIPVISKIIEKHVTKHLFAYLNKYNLIHISQSGFRQNHSCQTALIKLINNWLDHIGNGDLIGAMFFDLKKPLILLIIYYSRKNCRSIKFQSAHLIGLNPINAIEPSV